MFRRNNSGGFFKQIIKSITEPIKKFFTPKMDVEKEVKKEGRIKKFFRNIRESRGSTIKGTTKKIKVAKYSDYEIGWKQDKKPKGAIKDIVKQTGSYKINLYGKEVDVEKALKLEEFVDRYNEEIKAVRKELVDNLYKYLDPLIAQNVELNIQRAVEREEMRFNSATYDDLRDLDFKQFSSKILEATDFDEALADMLDKTYYNIQQRHEMYRENYIKAMFNEIGENTETLELAERLRNVSIDKFMVSYYDVYSDIDINFWYNDGSTTDERVNKVNAYFDELDKIDRMY